MPLRKLSAEAAVSDRLIDPFKPGRLILRVQGMTKPPSPDDLRYGQSTVFKSTELVAVDGNA
jgi:hypothetical protein